MQTLLIVGGGEALWWGLGHAVMITHDTRSLYMSIPTYDKKNNAGGRRFVRAFFKHTTYTP